MAIDTGNAAGLSGNASAILLQRRRAYEREFTSVNTEAGSNRAAK
jgi:hypothetical protein